MMLDTLSLQCPLIFFDIESTGISISKDKIIELCAIKIMPDKSRTMLLQRFYPEMPIPPSSTEIHGITDEMVKNEPTFREKAKEIAAFFSGCDLAGYNIAKFDIPLLVEELLRAGLNENPFEKVKVIDSLSIYFKKEPRNLAAALKFYANEEIVNAHSAEADVEATIKVLNGQLEKYPDMGQTTDALHEYSYQENDFLDYDRKFSRDKGGEIIFMFGKNKGLRVADNLGMVKWMLDKDFSEFTKFIARKILSGEIV
ncbi:MAG: 3'-5' exonuclease [Bacteroidetes bacterium]|nr:3'-5' exonuclease [Bacteroidota bacterium]